MTVERQAIAGLKWTALARLIGQTTAWLVTIAVVRILSPADYGLMALVSVVIAVATTLADMGLAATVVQARQLDPEVLRKLSGFVWVLHIAIAAIIAAAAPAFAWAFASPELTLLVQAASLQFLFVAAGAMPQALATRAMSFKWLAKVELASGVATSLLTLLLAMAGFAVWSLVIGALAGHALRALLLVAGGVTPRPTLRLSGLAAHLSFGSRVALSRLIWAAVSQADIVIGGRLLAREAVGSYSVAMSLATLPMQKIMAVVNQIAFATVARMQDEREHLRARVLLACRLIAMLGVPIGWGIAAVSQDLVPVLLGEKWLAAIVPLQAIAAVVPLRMVSAFLSTSVVAAGHARADLICTLVIAVVWPGLFLVGAMWGLDGLALAWLVAVPITFTINYPRTGGLLGIPLMQLLIATRAPLIAGIAMCLSVLSTRYMLLEFDALWRLPCLVLIGAVTYVASVLAIDRSLADEGRRVIKALAARG